MFSYPIFDVNSSILIMKELRLQKSLKNIDFLSLLTQIPFLVICSRFRSQSLTDILTGLLENR